MATRTATVVDWGLLAVPQLDGLDAKWTRYLARDTWYPPILPSVINGQVQIRELPLEYREMFQSAPLDHPNIKRAEELLNRWPEGAATVGQLVKCFCPVDSSENEGRRGVQCGSLTLPGWILATVYDPIGLAEGWVHEAAHIKLRLLGIEFENWDNLLLNNSPEELYESPIRKDKMRPMGAVLHGLYSYTYVTALDQRLYETAEGHIEKSNTAEYLDLNRDRIREGRKTVMRHAVPTERGAEFLRGLFAWIDDILSRKHEKY